MRIRKDFYALKLGVPTYDGDYGFANQRLCPFCGKAAGNLATGHTDRPTGDDNTRESVRRCIHCNGEWVQIQSLIPRHDIAAVTGGIHEMVNGRRVRRATP